MFKFRAEVSLKIMTMGKLRFHEGLKEWEDLAPRSNLKRRLDAGLISVGQPQSCLPLDEG